MGEAHIFDEHWNELYNAGGHLPLDNFCTLTLVGRFAALMTTLTMMTATMGSALQRLFSWTARWYARHVVLRIVQGWFDGPIYLTKLVYNRLSHPGQDMRELYSGCVSAKGVAYGDGRMEFAEIMVPESKDIVGVIFYVHGGGFVTTCPELYNQSMTYLCRHGFASVIVSYPKIPQTTFPTPQRSVLRALKFAMARFEGKPIVVLGDSAGANLALQAAAAYLNLHAKGRGASSRIVGAVSVYGMMERETCRNAARWDVMRRAMDFLWDCLEGDCSKSDEIFGGATFPQTLDHCKNLKTFPPTLLCVGSTDVLLDSSQRVNEIMKEKNSAWDVRLRVYKGGFHGFFGVPPAWQLGAYPKHGLPCSRDILDFCLECVLDGTSSSSEKNAKEEKRKAAVLAFPSGRMAIPRMEFIGIFIALQILVLMPLSIAAFPALLMRAASTFIRLAVAG